MCDNKDNKIEIDSNNSHSSNKINKNEKLFWLCFHNIYIRNQITNQLKLYGDNIKLIIKSSIREYINHPYREYISKLYYNTNDPLEPFRILSSDSIILLSFGIEFNGILKIGDIPTSVKKCWLNNLNYPLCEGLFPHGLVELKLGEFNQQLKRNQIPQSVTTLEIPSYDQSLEGQVIPTSCKYLDISGYSGTKQLDSIPPSVSTLVLSKLQLNSNTKIPSTVQNLKLPYYKTPLQVGDLGSSITELHLYHYNLPLSSGVIPSSVKYLFLNQFNQILKPGDLSEGLLKLDLGVTFNQILYPNTFPASLISITFGFGYRQQITSGIFSSSIKLIRFRNRRMKSLISHNSISSDTIIEFGSLGV